MNHDDADLTSSSLLIGPDVTSIQNELIKHYEQLHRSVLESADAFRQALNTQVSSDLLSEWIRTQNAVTAQIKAQIAEAEKAVVSALNIESAAFERVQSTALAEAFTENVKVFEEVVRRGQEAFERAELLPGLGWTLTRDMSFPDFRELVMQDKLTHESVGAWFLNYYTREEGTEFSRLKKLLLGSKRLLFWNPLMEQVFDAFERSQFAVCVPGMLLLVGGSVAQLWKVKGFFKEEKRNRFFDAKIAAAKDDSLSQLDWKCLAGFVRAVFEGADPNEHRPVLNRNLILHGNSDPKSWGKADCLRLLQAVSSVLWLATELDGNCG